MSNPLGKGRRRYFEGWYFKQQNDTETVALIPAFHVDDNGEASASLQVITDTQAYHIPFQAHSLRADPKKLCVRLGDCVFSEQGCKLDVKSEECDLSGTLRFGSLKSLSYDIMGPFSAMPFMECRHSVWSMFHRVDGTLAINGREYLFENSSGYLEGDRGRSFPRRYVWTQCGWDGNSIMLSVADIPFGAVHFTGCIGFILLDGKEYRIATYCGVKLISISDDTVLLRQGKLVLKIELLTSNSQLLRAPQKGNMSRLIHESASCQVRYSCSVNGKTLFDFVSKQASFENNWGNHNESIE